MTHTKHGIAIDILIRTIDSLQERYDDLDTKSRLSEGYDFHTTERNQNMKHISKSIEKLTESILLLKANE